MERITAYRWRGTVYPSAREARHAVDEAQGAILTRHARALAQLDRYAATLDYLERNAPDFAEVARLQDDLAELAKLEAGDD